MVATITNLCACKETCYMQNCNVIFLVSVAEKTRLSLACHNNPKATRLQLSWDPV